MGSINLFPIHNSGELEASDEFPLPKIVTRKVAFYGRIPLSLSDHTIDAETAGPGL
jgi:hypothetical protein